MRPYCAVTRGNWTERNDTRRNETGSPFALMSRQTQAKIAFRMGLSEYQDEGIDSRQLRWAIQLGAWLADTATSHTP
jgi:hypothetical protein